MGGADAPRFQNRERKLRNSEFVTKQPSSTAEIR